MVRELESRGYEVDQWDIVEGVDCLDILGFRAYPYDLLVHAAYMVGGRAAIDGVNTNFAENLALDALMFQYALESKVKRVLYFSSSAAYPVYLQDRAHYQLFGHSREMRLSETVPLEPHFADANYGFAKCVGERLAEDARKNGLAVTVVRPFSGYGEDQSLDYPFPSIVARAMHGDLSVWGPPGQTRDWIHVSDVCAGALAVVQSETTDPVNLCTGRGVEMGELACMIRARASSIDEVLSVTYDESKPTGVFYRVGDPTRLHQYYTPKVTLEEGIQRALKAQQ